MSFYDKVNQLCRSRGISITALAVELGFSKGTPTNWKSMKRPPRAENVKKLADYFEVPVSYFSDDVPNFRESKHENTPESKEAALKVPKSNLVFLPDANAYRIPLFESVSAGFGACPDNSIVSYELCNISSPAEAAETICIKVTGDSMYPKIEDGDIIQVHKQTSVDSGRIAVVLLDGEEALVKKVVYGADWIELHSFNPMYPVRRFLGADVLRLQVLGLVRKIIKNV